MKVNRQTLLVGPLSAGLALGVAELVAGFIGGQSSPLVAIGEAFIAATPGPVEAFAVRTFGTHDKMLLLTGMTLGLALVSVVIGVLAVRRRWVGIAGIGALGAVGAAAALTRPTASPVDALPSVIGALGGALAVVALARSAARAGVRRATPNAEPARPQAAPATIIAEGSPAEARALGNRPVSRRSFLAVAAVAGGAAAVSGGAGYGILRHRAVVSAASASSLRIPAPAFPAPPMNPAWDLNIPGLTSFFTPTAQFYRVDTELVVPQVDVKTWRLRIHGMVDKEINLTFDELVARPLVECDITLSCVSNEVGGRYASNGRWIGVPLKALLEEAGVKAGADQVVSRSVDGWTSGTPTADLMDGRNAILAVALNGKPLPAEHGYPVRMLVPGVYGYANATKWIVDIELSTFAAYKAYWAAHGYSQNPPPIKTLSRIDTPAPLANIKPGMTPIAGIAWAQHRGIQKVEVSVDNGPWQVARLSEQDNIDTWRQFVVMWDATPGEHSLQCRATDGIGTLQTSLRTPSLPDGATGWDSVVVTVMNS